MGHVGAVAAAGLALAGHEVLATDVDQERLDVLKAGKCPFYEPGLADWLDSACRQGNLQFLHADEFRESPGDVALVAVGTPPGDRTPVDLRGVNSAISWIKDTAPRDLVVVMKSTVPPGTGLGILRRELAGTGIGYAASPEFLRQGLALNDWQRPDRIVIGVAPGDGRSLDAASGMYAGPCFINPAPVLVTDITSAEMIKYASNAFLAARISFINEIAALCDSLGASIDDVSEGLALDSRTGARIHAGVGYGGSCLPKDTRALDVIAGNAGADLPLLRTAAAVNDRQRLLPVRALLERFGGSLRGVRVGLLGLAFKPGTDDVRDAPALDILCALRSEGAEVAAYDPRAMESARRQLPDGSIRFAPDALSASANAQALVIATEWNEIINADWPTIARRMALPRYVFDGRNALDPFEMGKLGFEYRGVGRNLGMSAGFYGGDGSSVDG